MSAAQKELQEFIASVPCEGKDETWDTLVLQCFAENDVKSLAQMKRSHYADFVWPKEGMTVGKAAFVK
eukprot:10634125-Karenia_brevis.AAC.1